MHFVLTPWRLHGSPKRHVDNDDYARFPRVTTALNSNVPRHQTAPRHTRCQATAAPAAPAAAPSLLHIARGVPDNLLANGTGMQLSFLGASNALPPGFRCDVV